MACTKKQQKVYFFEDCCAGYHKGDMAYCDADTSEKCRKVGKTLRSAGCSATSSKAYAGGEGSRIKLQTRKNVAPSVSFSLSSHHICLGTRTELCFGHGCSGHPILLEHERNYALGMDALVTLSSSNTNGIMLWAWILWSPCPPRTRTELCFGHGYSGHPVLLEHERNYALGMDTLVTLSSSNTNGIMLWAWILWSPCPPRTRTELCFGHGCSGHPILLEHERNYDLGMDTLVTLSSSNTNGIMLCVNDTLALH